MCAGQVWPWVQQEATASLEQLCCDLHSSWTAAPGAVSWSLATRHSSHNDFLSTYYMPGMRTPTGPKPCPCGNYVLRAQLPLTGTSSAQPPKSQAQIPDPRPSLDSKPRLQAQLPALSPQPSGSNPRPTPSTDPRPQSKPQKQTPDPDLGPDPRPQNQIPDPSPRSRP